MVRSREELENARFMDCLSQCQATRQIRSLMESQCTRIFVSQ